jgi:hypothetical protein
MCLGLIYGIGHYVSSFASGMMNDASDMERVSLSMIDFFDDKQAFFFYYIYDDKKKKKIKRRRRKKQY